MRPQAPEDPNKVDLEQEATCPNCKQDDLERIQVGGDGEWEDKLMCLDCFEVQQVNYDEVILPLIMRKYGLTRSQAEEVEEERRERYNRQLAQTSTLG